MRRTIALSLLALALFTTFASAKEQTDRSRPNRWRLEYRDNITGGTTEAVSVDYDGNLLPGDNFGKSIGESTHSWKKVWTGSIYVASGIVNVSEVFPSLLSSSSDVSKAFQGFVISTQSLESPTTDNLVGRTTTYITTDINQSSITPRNLLLHVEASTAGTPVTNWATTMTLVGCATFYGIDSTGKSNWEQIFFGTNPPVQLGGVALSSHVGVGNIAWAVISSFTVQLTSVTQNTDDFVATGLTVRLVVARGNKIGLSNTIESSGDIYQTSNPVTADAVNETVYFTLPPNGTRDYNLRYKARTSTP